MANDFLGSGISYSGSLYSSPTLLTDWQPTNSPGSAPSAKSVGGIDSIGGIASALGAFFSGQAQKSQFKFQADMFSLNAQHAEVMGGINARIAETAAQSELLRGQREYGAFKLRVGKLRSSQRAAMAANGIDLGIGNAAETLATTDMMSEIDGDTILANAARAAWGYRTQGVNSQIAANQQATNYRVSATFAETSANAVSPAMQAAPILLDTASRVQDTWYRFKKAGG